MKQQTLVCTKTKVTFPCHYTVKKKVQFMNKKTSQLDLQQYLTYKACLRIILKFHVDNTNYDQSSHNKQIIVCQALCDL